MPKVADAEEDDKQSQTDDKEHLFYWLEIIEEEEWQVQAYSCVINMLKNGIRVADIANDTLLNMQTFGLAEAFFEEDRQLILDWFQALIVVHTQFRIRFLKTGLDPDLNLNGFEGIEERHHNRFEELIKLAKKTYKKLDPERLKRIEAICNFEIDLIEKEMDAKRAKEEKEREEHLKKRSERFAS